MALFHTHFFFFFFFPSIMITTRSFALHYLFSLFAVECVEFLWVQVTSFLPDFFLKCFLASFLAQNRSSLSGDTKNTQQVLTNNNYNYYYQTYNNIKRGKKDKEKVNNE